MSLFVAKAQKKVEKTAKPPIDSLKQSVIEDAKADLSNNLSTISLDDNDLNDAGTQNVASVLTAGRDPFISAASFNFFALRFRIRGYDGDMFGTFINGISMDNLDNGFTPFALWGGLNDVTRNRDMAIGLKPNSFAFGDFGNTTYLDMRAIKQRKQTEIGYAFSNRNFNHKIDATYSSGLNKKGWAYSFSFSRRYADEAYFPGTFYNSWSYFGAVDKKLGQNHTLSLVAFGAPTSVGRQGLGVKEAFDLVGRDYNPSWGWQMGKKRNASVTRTNQPVVILTHDFRINNNTNIVTAASFSKGDRGTSQIDWYNAANPNPLYYRNLPSYWADENIKSQLTEAWKTDDNVRQINWHKLYAANRSVDTGIGVQYGKRARYLLGENVVNAQRINFNTVFNTRFGEKADFTAGASYQYQKNHCYKKVLDLLGADYFVDRNQFAERFNQVFADSLGQANLNNPDRRVKEGDDYSYNYEMHVKRAATWAQIVLKGDRIDWFASLEISNTRFYRVGNYRNGMFSNNSFGKSQEYNFNNFGFKSGFTYKLDGRNYFFGNVGMSTRAPFFDNVFTSLRTRNTVQDNVTSERINTIEAGYVLNAPKVKVRLTGYYTEFKNQMNVLTFFHDTYLNLVNYGITGINKAHSGGELGIEAKILPNLTLNAAAAVGRYYFTNNQQSVTTIDNDASVVARDEIFSKGYYVGGTPQEAYSIGLNYRSPKFWMVGLTLNRFDMIYGDINPSRRTEKVVQGYSIGDPMRNSLLDQVQLPHQYTLDMFANWSWKLPKNMSINNKNTFLVFSLSASNLLDNRNIIPFFTENLRFEHSTFQFFPGRFNYGYGRNFSASIALRF